MTLKVEKFTEEKWREALEDIGEFLQRVKPLLPVNSISKTRISYSLAERAYQKLKEADAHEDWDE